MESGAAGFLGGNATRPKTVREFARDFRRQNSAPSFLACSHYDDQDFRQRASFVGANDAGSSTGVLVELARVLAERPELASKVELVFFDGEEAYEAFTDTDGLFGSRYFAQQLVAQDKAKLFRGGLLFDMIGDKSLTITLPPGFPTGAGARHLRVRGCPEIAKAFYLLR